MSPELLWLVDALDNIGALLLFGIIFIGAYTVLFATLLFCALAMQVAWRWLASHTWRDVIVAAERWALR